MTIYLAVVAYVLLGFIDVSERVFNSALTRIVNTEYHNASFFTTTIVLLYLYSISSSIYVSDCIDHKCGGIEAHVDLSVHL